MEEKVCKECIRKGVFSFQHLHFEKDTGNFNHDDGLREDLDDADLSHHEHNESLGELQRRATLTITALSGHAKRSRSNFDSLATSEPESLAAPDFLDISVISIPSSSSCSLRRTPFTSPSPPRLILSWRLSYWRMRRFSVPVRYSEASSKCLLSSSADLQS